MPNPKPDMSGLTPFTSERAREVSRRPRKKRLLEPVDRVQVVLYERQLKALSERGVSRSALLRRLLDEWLTRTP